MTTSLNEIKQIEDFLQGKLKPEDSLFFRVRILINPFLRKNVSVQQKIYSIIGMYGRRKLKSEIASIQEKIFEDPARSLYRKNIEQLFSKF